LDADGRFRVEHTGRGADRSPLIELSGLNPDAVSLCVILTDLDHPIFGTMAHWVVWNIPAALTIPAAIPVGAIDPATGIVQGRAYGWHRYRGPKPPRGTTHRYELAVYALGRRLAQTPKLGKRRLLKLIAPHVLQAGSIIGSYE
jgi:Raf kinase inhibitor-like YbhB/YbcL family protein